MIYIVAVLIGLAVGCLFGMQPSVNGSLSAAVQHPLHASVISFASGTVLLIVVSAIFAGFPPRFSTPPGDLPIWIWLGGSIGVVVVTTSLVVVPRVGSLLWFASLITGQILMAILLDHFGWLGTPKASISVPRLIGAGLLVSGLMVIVWAKWSETKADSAVNEATQSGQAGGIGENHA